jgi:SAM-dependent methyltransferase
VLDVGGGDSRLVDFLLFERGVRCVYVLDISRAALTRARERLADAASRVQWIEADVAGDWPTPSVNIWHDRAVFHFLTDPADRLRYRARMEQAVRPGGAVIIATFAEDGPEKCSGLPVVRYSPDALQAELGGNFRLQEAVRETHETPFRTTQEFWYCRFARPPE